MEHALQQLQRRSSQSTTIFAGAVKHPLLDKSQRDPGVLKMPAGAIAVKHLEQNVESQQEAAFLGRKPRSGISFSTNAQVSYED